MNSSWKIERTQISEPPEGFDPDEYERAKDRIASIWAKTIEDTLKQEFMRGSGTVIDVHAQSNSEDATDDRR